MSRRSIRPAGWKAPKGYENGVLVAPGRSLLFIAGQIAWDAEQRLVGGADFSAQFRQALSNVLDVVRTAGGTGQDLVALTIYVTDKRQYMDATRQLGAAWRELIGATWPSMALVEVSGLLEPGALVEIQGIAAIECSAPLNAQAKARE